MRKNDGTGLKSLNFQTKLGPMIAIADEAALYLLEFIDCRGLTREMERLQQHTKSTPLPGMTAPLHSIETEIKQYFEGNLTEFETPFIFLGSSFQQRVWKELLKIPFGETRSYADVAKAIGRPSAFRAVANANGANQLALLIPCHRVINANGALGGYGGGIERKKQLLSHERPHHPSLFSRVSSSG